MPDNGHRRFSGEIAVKFTLGRRLHSLSLTDNRLTQCTTRRPAKSIARRTALNFLKNTYGKDFGLKGAKPVELPTS